MRIFLSGGIEGHSYKEANTWREEATKLLKPNWCYNPCSYLPKELHEGILNLSRLDTPLSALERNDEALKLCNVMLVKVCPPSIGTLMELGEARGRGMLRVGWGNGEHSNNQQILFYLDEHFLRLGDACRYILDHTP
jgi:hypothetical protein|tara:strand:+ start:5189 stop:5599 length:411 start_codon:yes stop_codon:yes gene_type:complete